MRILKLNEKDIQKIIDLDIASFGLNYDLPAITEKQVRKILGKGIILGIKENGILISNIQVAEKKKNVWFIEGIATIPEKQHKGLAEILLKKAIKISRQKRIMKISALIRPCNQKSINLFLKNGFKKIKIIENYYGKGKDRILAELAIK
ncbi:MAG: GNAT family N-acetyltransferase [archaeon]